MCVNGMGGCRGHLWSGSFTYFSVAQQRAGDQPSVPLRRSKGKEWIRKVESQEK